MLYELTVIFIFHNRSWNSYNGVNDSTTTRWATLASVYGDRQVTRLKTRCCLLWLARSRTAGLEGRHHLTRYVSGNVLLLVGTFLSAVSLRWIGRYTVSVSLSLYTLTVLTVAAFSVRFVVHCTFRFGNSWSPFGNVVSPHARTVRVLLHWLCDWCWLYREVMLM